MYFHRSHALREISNRNWLKSETFPMLKDDGSGPLGVTSKPPEDPLVPVTPNSPTVKSRYVHVVDIFLIPPIYKVLSILRIRIVHPKLLTNQLQ